MSVFDDLTLQGDCSTNDVMLATMALAVVTTTVVMTNIMVSFKE